MKDVIPGVDMLEFYQNPFFWAGISLLGLLGANATVNTQFGKKFPIFGQLSGFLFTIGRIIMVLPFIPQPRKVHMEVIKYSAILI